MRRGFEASLHDVPDIGVVDTVGSVPEAWSSPVIGEVDVVLVSVGAEDAIGFISEIRAFAAPAVVVVGTAEQRPLLRRAIDAGAVAALDRDVLTPRMTAAAIRTAAEGGTFALNDLFGEGNEDDGPIATLSEREQRVLALVADGLPTREVALQMAYSERTVKKVLGDVVVKLGARSRSQAIARAVRQGII